MSIAANCGVELDNKLWMGGKTDRCPACSQIHTVPAGKLAEQEDAERAEKKRVKAEELKREDDKRLARQIEHFAQRRENAQAAEATANQIDKEDSWSDTLNAVMEFTRRFIVIALYVGCVGGGLLLFFATINCINGELALAIRLVVAGIALIISSVISAATYGVLFEINRNLITIRKNTSQNRS
jgi:hypothetical protein